MINIAGGKSGTANYHLMLPVWGDAYVSLFLNYVLPSHLAPGNLPGLPLETCTYQIFTRKTDLEQFHKSPAFRRLNETVKVCLETIEPDANAHEWMTTAYNWGFDSCKNKDVAFVFLCPDCIYGNNSFRNLHRMQSQGKRAIMVCGVRVLKEHFLPILDTVLESDKTVLDIPHRQLMAMMYDHLHPFSAAHICKNNMNGSPQLFFWQVENEGLLAHCFHVHPLLIRPQDTGVRATSTVDAEFLLQTVSDYESVHVVTDSDDICFVDATPLSKLSSDAWGFFDVKVTQSWAQSCTNDFHRRIYREGIYLHSTELSDTWQPYKTQAAALVDAILKGIPPSPASQQTPSPPKTMMSTSAASISKAIRWCYQKLFSRVLGSVTGLEKSLAETIANLNYLQTRLAYLERQHAAKHRGSMPWLPPRASNGLCPPTVKTSIERPGESLVYSTATNLAESAGGSNHD